MTAPILWKPDPDRVANSQMTAFREFVNKRYSLNLEDYFQLYDWSIEKIPDFWESCFDFVGINHHARHSKVVDDMRKMPGANWFRGTRMNYAENLLRYRDDHIAIHFRGEDQVKRQLSYAELFTEVERLAHALRKAGIKAGDRIAGFMPNMPETIIAMLATASIGAIWSSSSPDFGIKGVLDRFSQIKPRIIFAADGYFYAGKRFDSLEKLKGMLKELPDVEKVVIADYTQEADLSGLPLAISWDNFILDDPDPLTFNQLPFSHPLYIMYSSGTTGLPKSIVHSAGGTLLQHLKELKLHGDLRRNDTIFYFTTCGWMMWNWLVSSLAVGASIVLYDGNPFYPDSNTLWDMADELDISIFGTSAKYLDALQESGARPSRTHSLSNLKSILSTGSPLSGESFEYVYRDIKNDLMLGSIAGGTDLISCFALSNPTLPVYRGELQCRGLGMAVEAYGDDGQAVINAQGELVCTKAFPSMPIYFWNDEDGQKYHNAYFADYPGIWRHGDFIEINSHGGVTVYGRSDATLNPGGVRIGTSEIYAVVENIDGIVDSLVVGQKWEDDERIILFLKLHEGVHMGDELENSIRKAIRSNCSPRHLPAKIIAVADIPYTINGKKVEIAVKKIIHGLDVPNRSALANPDSLDLYLQIPELQS